MQNSLHNLTNPVKLTHKGRAKRHPTDRTSKLMHKVTKTLHTPT